jgi:hypothetical protein
LSIWGHWLHDQQARRSLAMKSGNFRKGDSLIGMPPVMCEETGISLFQIDIDQVD